ncbi:MAG: aldolase/citrate lyase family protein, partial [Chloroflexota bacterium]
MTVYPLDAAERLHQRLTDDSVCVGVNISITEPTITEIICGAGYDFLWIDAEHSSIDLPVLNNHIRAAAITQTPVVVRVQWNHPGLVKAVLDMGATGVLFPLAKTVADVEQAIAA